MVLKDLPACPAKLFTLLLEALLDGVVTFCHLLSAKPRRIAGASLVLLRSARRRSCIATSQSQHKNRQ
jgi:hypothetical protein